MGAYAYDERDRLVQVTDALGGDTRYTYDTAGNLLAVADELEQVNRYEYDSRNRLVGSVDPESVFEKFLGQPSDHEIDHCSIQHGFTGCR